MFKGVGEGFDKYRIAVTLRHFYQFEDFPSQTVHLHAQLNLIVFEALRCLILDIIKLLNTRLGLGATCFGHAPHPFKLAGKGIAGFFDLAVKGLSSSFFLFEIIGVISFVPLDGFAVDL